jgi:hypothetical protein
VWLAVPVRGKWRRQATKGVHLLQPKAGFVVLKPYSRLAGWEIQLIREILESKNFPPSGMIQQERQNNIINILGGHSYAM